MLIRRAATRGKANHGWLNASFTFSFADYYDPRYNSFGYLRVMNEDYIGPGGGFPTHPHRDIEILTFCVEGRLSYKDSTGSEGELYPGRIQMITAGTGIRHSGGNPSDTETAHGYQIWLTPIRKGLTPQQQELDYDPEESRNNLRLIVSPERKDGSLQIHQKTWIYETKLDPGRELALPWQENSLGWLQLIKGKLIIGGQTIDKSDGVAFEATPQPARAVEDSHFLYFLMTS